MNHLTHDVPVVIHAFDRIAGMERVNVLKTKYPDLAEQIDWMAGEDPTGGNQKYLEYAVRQLQKAVKDRSFMTPDNAAAGIMDLVTRFHKVFKFLGKGDLKDVHKDINKFKTLDDLQSMLGQAEPVARQAEADYEKVYEDDDWVAFDLKNKAALCSLGQENWCVARPSQQHYENYARRPHRFILTKSKHNENTQYLAYVVGGSVDEIKDYDDNDPSPDEVPMAVFDKLGINVDLDRLDHEEDEEETQFAHIFYVEVAGDVMFAAQSRRAVEAWARDDETVRAAGYDIYQGSVTEDRWNEYEAGEITASDLGVDDPDPDFVTSADPETETRYLVLDYMEKDVIAERDEGGDGLESLVDAEAFVAENDTTETGYAIIEVEVPIDRIDEDADKWRDLDWTLVDEREPGEEAKAEAAQLVEVYFSTITENEVPFISAVAADAASLPRDSKGREEVIYKGTVLLGDMRRAERTHRWNKLQPQNSVEVDVRPEETVNRFVIYRNGRPEQGFIPNTDMEEVNGFWKRMTTGDPLDAFELREITISHDLNEAMGPGASGTLRMWTEDARYKGKPVLRGSRTLRSYEPIRTGTHSVSVDQNTLDALPVGAALRWEHPAIQTVWTKTHPDVWQAENGTERHSNQFFPFHGARINAVISFPGGEGAPVQTPEINAQSYTPEQLTGMPAGTYLLLEGAEDDYAFQRTRRPEPHAWRSDATGSLLASSGILELATGGIKVYPPMQGKTVEHPPKAEPGPRVDPEAPVVVPATPPQTPEESVIVPAQPESQQLEMFASVIVPALEKAAASPVGIKELQTLVSGPHAFGVLSGYDTRTYEGPKTTDHKTDGPLQVSKKDNQQAHGLMMRELQRRGYTPGQIRVLRGHWGGRAEQSFLVLDMTFEDALELGRLFEQDSVIWKGADGVLAMYSTKPGGEQTAVLAKDSDGNIATSAPARVDIKQKDPKEKRRGPPAATENISKAQSTSFQFDFDWGTAVPFNGPLTKEDVARAIQPKEKPDEKPEPEVGDATENGRSKAASVVVQAPRPRSVVVRGNTARLPKAAATGRVVVQAGFELTAFEVIAGRLDDVKAYWRKRIDPNGLLQDYLGADSSREDALIDSLARQDPSGQNKYLAWMAEQVIGQSADEATVVDVARRFHEQGSRVPKEYRDLGRLDLFTAEYVTERAEAQKTHSQKKQEVAEGATLIDKKPAFSVYEIKNKEASCALGAGTKWCITMRDQQHYEDYVEAGTRFFFVLSTDGDKHAVAADKEHGAFEIYDAQDKLVGPNDLPPGSLNSVYRAVGHTPERAEETEREAWWDEGHLENQLKTLLPNPHASNDEIDLRAKALRKEQSGQLSNELLALMVARPSLSETMRWMVEETPNQQVLSYYVRRPDTPPETVMKVIKDRYGNGEILASALANPNVSQAELLKWAPIDNMRGVSRAYQAENARFLTPDAWAFLTAPEEMEKYDYDDLRRLLRAPDRPEEATRALFAEIKALSGRGLKNQSGDITSPLATYENVKGDIPADVVEDMVRNTRNWSEDLMRTKALSSEQAFALLQEAMTQSTPRRALLLTGFLKRPDVTPEQLETIDDWDNDTIPNVRQFQSAAYNEAARTTSSRAVIDGLIAGGAKISDLAGNPNLTAADVDKVAPKMPTSVFRTFLRAHADKLSPAAVKALLNKAPIEVLKNAPEIIPSQRLKKFKEEASGLIEDLAAHELWRRKGGGDCEIERVVLNDSFEPAFWQDYANESDVRGNVVIPVDVVYSDGTVANIRGTGNLRWSRPRDRVIPRWNFEADDSENRYPQWHEEGGQDDAQAQEAADKEMRTTVPALNTALRQWMEHESMDTSNIDWGTEDGRGDE